jgi:glycine dehydrogenase subunit 1
MRYIPNTDGDVDGMLRSIGAPNVEALFEQVPRSRRMKGPLALPPPMSEKNLLDRLGALAGQNANLRERASFLGAGTYHHFIPSVVSALAGRSEFATSYTPYQPEISQGTLMAMFEYQSYMCMLTGMDVSNASMYDGASSAAEAALMALRIRKRGRILVSRAAHPDYRKVIGTYCGRHASEIVEAPFDGEGRTDLEAVKGALPGAACLLVQSPNFLGVIERLGELGAAAKEAGALFVVMFTEPVAYGLLRPPGESGADIVCGEGQSLGIPPGFGGPHLGILTTKKEHLRNLPGRIVGRGVDKQGRSAYVLTLTAREQHIRREKATSNICTNEGLCALTASIFLSALGKRGFRELALLNFRRAEYAKKALAGVPGLSFRFPSPVFNELVVRLSADPEKVVDELASTRDARPASGGIAASSHSNGGPSTGLLAGVPLGRYYDDLADCLLLTFTEMNSFSEIDALAGAMRRALSP